MNKSKSFFCFIFIASLMLGISCNYNPEKQNPYLHLFQSLQGSWAGCAIKTPIGPRPYDIHFRLDEKGDLNGMASPGPVADHFWSYQIDDEVLWLEFLTTFRGNKESVWLSAVEKNKKTVVFRSKKVRKLKVEVTIKGDTQKIEIYLFNRPHVSIQLVRNKAKDNSVGDCLQGKFDD